MPPAWTDVWIAADSNSHLQATGRDARGRKQYRYHATFRARRDAVKFDRMAAFGTALPALRRRIAADLELPGIPRQRVLAAVVTLIDQTLIRVGNEEYARSNGSFGASTVRSDHVAVRPRGIDLVFPGKHGRRLDIRVDDVRLARVVRRCQDLPGQRLFAFVGDDGCEHAIGSSDVNDYLRVVTGEELTAKDFRTWGATALFVELVCEQRADPTDAVALVADRLGNTTAIARRSYIEPRVFAAAADETLCAHPIAHRSPDLRPSERRLLSILEPPCT